MNNSFPRLIDGLCATLRAEVLSRLDDEFARGQVFGVINVLNTFKVRADWSAGFLLAQIGAQQQALDALRPLVGVALPDAPLPAAAPAAELLARRDEGNRALQAVMQWLDGEAGAWRRSAANCGSRPATAAIAIAATASSDKPCGLPKGV